MAANKRPTSEDRLAAIRIALGAVAAGVDLNELASDLEPLHPKNDVFPGEVLLELAADALEEGGSAARSPSTMRASASATCTRLPSAARLNSTGATTPCGLSR
jgi:hypothetical protein